MEFDEQPQMLFMIMPKLILRDHQKEALSKMKNGCILCGGVGSGKSITGLAYYFFNQGGRVDSEGYLSINTKPKDLYIITTARKRDTYEWDKEMSYFLLSRDSELNYCKNKVVVDSWNNIKKYSTITDAFFIFDEQRVVGSGTWVKAFLKIAKSNQWILLSATPGDTWMDYIPVFIANGFYKNRTEFIGEHVMFKQFGGYRKVYRYLGVRKLIRLRESILIGMDFKRDTIPHHEAVITSYDILRYKSIGRERWNPYTDKPIKNASELCLTWRRLVNSDESRQVALLEIFEKHPKIIVFYNYNYELDILRNLHYGDNVEVAEWNSHKHQPIPESDSWVYLVQYIAGCEGWNCVKTDTIVFWSQSYSYKQMTQAAGRINRLNTPYRDLYYYHMKSKSPIDLAISRALQNKKDFNNLKFAGSYFPKK